MGDVIRAWATEHAIEVADPAPQQDWRVDARVDFGRLEQRVPGVVVRPRDVAQLAATLAMLRERRVPYKIRGAAHSSGGQVLIEGGAVVDLRRLGRILDDDPEQQLVTVEGGATWLDVATHLHAGRRRPLCGVIDQLETSVAGVLSVGGFADGSHREGLVAASVRAMTFVTASGDVRRLVPGDELFDLALCGRGQLGAIAEVTLATQTKGPMLAARLLRWFSVEEFVRDALAISRDHLYDYMRARLVWDAGGRRPRVDATIGMFCDREHAPDLALGALRPAIASNIELVDLLARLREPALEARDASTAALELVLPLPDTGLWAALNDRIVASGVLAHVRRGVGALVIPTLPRLPLAPLPTSEACLALALRPHGTPEVARGLIPALREIATFALAHGARIYLMGVERLDAEQLALQWGDALPRLRALKAELDPQGLCNPGLLE